MLVRLAILVILVMFVILVILVTSSSVLCAICYMLYAIGYMSYTTYHILRDHICTVYSMLLYVIVFWSLDPISHIPFVNDGTKVYYSIYSYKRHRKKKKKRKKSKIKKDPKINKFKIKRFIVVYEIIQGTDEHKWPCSYPIPTHMHDMARTTYIYRIEEHTVHVHSRAAEAQHNERDRQTTSAQLISIQCTYSFKLFCSAKWEKEREEKKES